MSSEDKAQMWVIIAVTAIIAAAITVCQVAWAIAPTLGH